MPHHSECQPLGELSGNTPRHASTPNLAGNTVKQAADGSSPSARVILRLSPVTPAEGNCKVNVEVSTPANNELAPGESAEERLQRWMQVTSSVLKDSPLPEDCENDRVDLTTPEGRMEAQRRFDRWLSATEHAVTTPLEHLLPEASPALEPSTVERSTARNLAYELSVLHFPSSAFTSPMGLSPHSMGTMTDVATPPPAFSLDRLMAATPVGSAAGTPASSMSCRTTHYPKAAGAPPAEQPSQPTQQLDTVGQPSLSPIDTIVDAVQQCGAVCLQSSPVRNAATTHTRADAETVDENLPSRQGVALADTCRTMTDEVILLMLDQ